MAEVSRAEFREVRPWERDVELRESRRQAGGLSPIQVCPELSVETGYGALARESVSGALRETVDLLEALPDKPAPHDPSLRPTRKHLLRTRDLLDMFAHAYGKGSQEAKWKGLRDQVDQGYERLGAYKDLWESQGLKLAGNDARGDLARGKEVAPRDVQYDKGLKKERLNGFLNWRSQFLEPDVLQDALALAASANDKPAGVKTKHLTRFYWGGVEVAPKGDLTGIENMRRLGRYLNQNALEDLRAFKELESPLGKANEKPFHDFRKRLRSLWNLLQYFPDVYRGEPARYKEVDAQLRELVTRLGYVEDAVVAVHLAKSDTDRKAAERNVKKRWTKFQAWRHKAHVRALLENLAKDLR